MLDFIKKHKYLFISFGIVILIFLYYVLLNNSVFLFEGDAYEEPYKFYVEAWNRLRDGSLPFWDWSNFLGNNYYGSNTFYFLGSPFFWLAMCLPSIDLIPYSFLYLCILKSLLCVTFAYMWLYKINKDSLASSIGSLIITFSSFMLFNYIDYIINDPVPFVLLCLYSVERYLQDKKIMCLALSVGYLGIVSYYFLYLFIPFAFIYALIRYFTIYNRTSYKNILKVGVVFVIVILLGVLLSSITLLPSYFAIENNPRSDAIPNIFNTVGKLTYFRFLTSFLTPVCDWRINLNSFVSIDTNPGIGWSGGFADYSLILSVFCFVLLFFINNKKEKISGYVLIGIYALFAMFPFFYILFNQNYESRWVYIFTFLLAYIVSIVIHSRRDLRKKHFIIAGLVALFAIWTSYLITTNFSLNTISWEINILKRNCIATSTFIVLYFIVFSYFSNSKIVDYLLLIVVFCEIIFSFYSTFYGVNDETYQPMTKEKLEMYNKSYKSAAQLIIDNDDSFYRVDKDKVYLAIGNNDTYFQRYKSFYSYHSVYNYNQIDFIKNRFLSFNVFYPQTGKNILKSMLGCKYWFTYEKEGKYSVPYGYSFYRITDDGGTIYKNDYPITFAYFRDKETSVEDFNKMDTFHQDYLMLNHVVLENTQNSDIKQMLVPTVIKEYGGNIDKVAIKENGGHVYLTYNNDIIFNNESYTYPYWNYLNNDEVVLSGKLNKELSYIGLSLSNNDDILEVNHIIPVTIYYDDMSWYEDWYNSQEMVDPDSVKWDDNSISGTITTTKDGYIVTSVPYDKGWTVKLDGKKIDYLKVNEGFVGFTITPGTHTIEMNYVPPGLILGSIISISSLILCFVLYYLNKKDKIKLC